MISVRRRTQTLRTYGLTPAGYDGLLLAQGGQCAICRSSDPHHWSGRFQVDHNHTTDTVRGLLCAPCNGGLGLLGDTLEKLQAALSYVNARRSPPDREGSDITAQIAAAGFFRAS